MNKEQEVIKREKLADLCHKQWSGWLKYMFGKCLKKADGTILIPEWAVIRWRRQAYTPYNKLSPKEKDSDRSEADKFIALLTEIQVPEGYLLVKADSFMGKLEKCNSCDTYKTDCEKCWQDECYQEPVEKPPVISMAVAVDDCDITDKPPMREPTKLIPLTQGKYTIVDEKNYDMLSKHTWYAKCECGIWYAVREIRDAEGKRTTQRMHRYILNCPKGKDVDHKNHNGLDNRESNIRICTNSQNQQNQRPCRGGSSKYKGVSFRKDTNRWTAHIKNGGKLINLGNYGTEIEAAKIYDAKAQELFGEYACLNLQGSSEFTKKWRIKHGEPMTYNERVVNSACDIIDKLEHKARLSRIVITEALEECIGDDIEKVTIILEQALKVKE